MLDEKLRQEWLLRFENNVSLKFAPDFICDDKELVLFRVNQDGLELKYASESLQGDKEVVFAAINQNRLALQYVSYELQLEIIEKGLDVLNSTFGEECVKAYNEIVGNQDTEKVFTKK